jgi:enoyl-CoA hydratase/carnithine racemase
LEHDDDLRAGVLFGHGEHFTAGLDLLDVYPALVSGQSLYPDDGLDPWRLDYTWTKPLVAVAHGWCMTLGIELLLAADIRIAAANTRFSQLEVKRGTYPFGGATLRFWREAGWGNAMRWLLTGDEFDAAEALRIGVVQEIADDGEAALNRATALATAIAEESAPLAVRAALASAHRSRDEGDRSAAAYLLPTPPRCSPPPTAPKASNHSLTDANRGSPATDSAAFSAGVLPRLSHLLQADARL